MALVLKVLSASGTAYGGFQWNTEIGSVTTCPDWKATEECGNGLHGWLRGSGNLSASHLVDDSDAVWLVLDVDDSSIVHLKGKVKFPSAQVVFKGSRSECATYIAQNEPNAQGVHFVNLTGGDWATLTGGYRATLTGGYRATLTGGYWATLTGGDGAMLLFKWWDGARIRIAVAYVGENNILPGVAYKCVDGNIIPA